MATLSRLSLTDEEITRYTEQLGAILAYASHLPSLDDQPDRFTMTTQGDEARVTEQPHDLLRNAVAFEDGYVKVPAILDKSES